MAGILALQRTVGNHAVATALAAQQNARRATAATRRLQRIHIKDTIGDLTDEGPSGQAVTLTTQEKAVSVNIAYTMRQWRRNMARVETRRDAILAEQQWLALNGARAGGTNAALIAKAIVKVTKGQPEETIGFTGYKTRDDNDIPKHWPFTLRLSSRYGADATARETYLRFSHDKYGYITRIVDGTTDHSMQVPPAAAGQNQYSSLHGVDESRDLMTQATAMADPHDTDDQTKLIAEGARWNAVGVKAAAGGLTDTTMFYPLTNAGGQPWFPTEPVPFVTLSDLWTQWNKFKKNWNIADGELKDLLLQRKVCSGTTALMFLAEQPNTHGI